MSKAEDDAIEATMARQAQANAELRDLVARQCDMAYDYWKSEDGREQVWMAALQEWLDEAKKRR